MQRIVTTLAILAGAWVSACSTPADEVLVSAEPARNARTSVGGPAATASPITPEFAVRVVVTGLEDPFEVTYGPDGYLWVTERTAGRVVRVDPDDGTIEEALTIDEVMVTEGTQDGLLGMALHTMEGATAPEHVFLAYTYDDDDSDEGEDRRIKVVRYTYDVETESLLDPMELIRGIYGSNDHNSGRVVLGPDERLYMTIGDQGNNQYANVCQPIEAQRLPTADEVENLDWSAYQGKSLRMELDGSIPEDNPVLDGVRSHVYTYGHRNAQGLAFGPSGLYAVEHGPKTDDELNLLVSGGNYGWPHVAGFQDDQAYVYANWSLSEDPPCEELTYDDFAIPASVPQMEESDWSHPDFQPPLRTFFTVSDDFDFTDETCGPDYYYACWPTVAPSSVAWYDAGPGRLPVFGSSLLITTLKHGAVYQVKIGPDGRPVGPGPTAWFRSVNRYRDLAFSPDGQRIYVATDSSGLVRDRRGAPTTELANPGSILEFRTRAH